MPSIAITGGIATGKSIATSFLAEKINAIPFCADQEVAHLLDENREVTQEITDLFGPTIYHGQKKADRVCLRAHLIDNPESKKKLEEILHPRLRTKWLSQAKEAKGKRQPFFLAEIPLLYENDLAPYFDHIIVVAASEQIQLHRLTQDRKLSCKIASALLRLQLPLLEKINRANQVIWNDGTIIIFYEQLQRAASLIKQ